MDIEESDKNDEIGTPDLNKEPNDKNHNGDSGMITHNMRYNGNDPNSRDRKGEDMILYKKSCGFHPEFGYGNGHINMTSESGTKFIATPEELTGDYPRFGKRHDASNDTDNNNNSKDSDDTSSNYTNRND